MQTNKRLLFLFTLFVFFNQFVLFAQNTGRQNPIDTAKLLKANGISAPASKVEVEPAPVGSVNRQVVRNDYQSVAKPPTSEVFGASFFSNESLSFEPNLRIGIPPNYILGPDDELTINVSGYQEMNIKTPVQPEGSIFIQQVGTVSVNGLTIEDATVRIRDKMSQTAYPSLRAGASRLTITLSKIRSIHITAIGAAKSGNFTVSSLSSLFNSLYLCGGPGAINTYRNIELIRNNKIIQHIDIYQFLTRGDQRGNVSLREGDVINFPVYKKRVTIAGAVKRPGVFELKDGETLDDLLFFAGGYTNKAYKASIKVKQNTDTERKIKNILKLEISTYMPADGDEFEVEEILNIVENAVSINGAVYRPGEFELTPGLTISGLIKRSGGLRENAFTDRATLTRMHPDGTSENFTFNVANIMKGGADDMQLIKKDVINIAAINDFKSTYAVTIAGEVRKPGSFPYQENLSLRDLFFMAGGFTDAASPYHVEIGRRIINERINKDADSIAIVYDVNIEKALNIENNKFILKPFDVVTVRKNPGYTEQKSVNITGEVNYPGAYTIGSKKERISDLIKRAGGLTSLANPNGVFLIRNTAQTNDSQQQVAKTIQTSIKDTSVKVLEDITRTNFRIPIDINTAMNNPGSLQDYILEDHDEIQILKFDPLVKLSGEVLISTKTGFIEGKNIQYYLSQAGGTTDNARRSKIYVLYANGHIKRTKNGIFGIFRSYPRVEEGAEIVVPKKIEKKGTDATTVVSTLGTFISLISLVIITITTLKK